MINISEETTIASEAEKHLLERYYPLTMFFSRVGKVSIPQKRNETVQLAIPNIVIGQMLSSKAASAIQLRFRELLAQSSNDILAITDEDMLKCGLSARKVKTIRDFERRYRCNPSQIEDWRHLSFDQLNAEVSQSWGLSTWSAEMLAIFYFGHQDVFPMADGSIKRATALIKSHYAYELNPNLAEPFRTVLASYLWASLDRDHWKAFEEVAL